MERPPNDLSRISAPFLPVLYLALLTLHFWVNVAWAKGEEVRVTASAGDVSRPSGPEIRLLVGERYVLPGILGGIVDSLSTYYASGPPRIWCKDGHIEDRAIIMIEELEHAADEGLDPGRYRAAELRELVHRLRQGDERIATEFEVLLTGYTMLYARDVSSGRLDPRASRTPWHTSRDPLPLLDLMERIAGSSPGDLRRIITSLPPSHEQYRALRQQLERYRKLEQKLGWDGVPGGPVVEPGEPMDPGRRGALAMRLHREGFLKHSGDDGSVLDPELANALRAFQELRGIDPDGVLGPETLRELNRSPGQRIETIAMNMERWRWVPADLGRKYLHVNTAAFRLEAREEGRTALDLKVIVGKRSWSTPVFSDQVKTIVFNPYWNVPQNIAVEDIIPRIREDETYLKTNGMVAIDRASGEAVESRDVDWEKVASGDQDILIRQQPGPLNPLGKIKFLFPNTFSIYLHDTPKEELFQRTDRAFSHGCIRVDRPLDLAAFLLEPDAAWPVPRIEDTYRSDKHLAVAVPAAVPVYIFYWTAWVNQAGQLEFHQDHYGIDQDQARAGAIGRDRSAHPDSSLALRRLGASSD